MGYGAVSRGGRGAVGCDAVGRGGVRYGSVSQGGHGMVRSVTEWCCGAWRVEAVEARSVEAGCVEFW